MKNFGIAKTLFRDSVTTSFYFDSMSAELARKKVIDTLDANHHSLLFLIGDAGVGKTHMLHVLHRSSSFFPHSILMPHAYFEWQELFLRLYTQKGVLFDETLTQALHVKQLTEIYQESLCTIFIDEAHLLGKKQCELLATLCHNKVFRCVLSVPCEAKQKMLEHPSFTSCSKASIVCGLLAKHELHRYLQSYLMVHSQGEIALMFSAHDAKKIARYAKGNFRTIRHFLYTLFHLLEFSQNQYLLEYTTLSNRLLMMTALEIGLICDR
ncbi:ATP-binding protein [Sulfurospirillum barnesii]|uniref:ORC1/DEAH AAA+ ATPase domain-containing protein n=1 Tax=Sulfurospirillum barnesii (strain ATCC 700032 / DSM 10660 / SES-3) TaxID=760154 RepID=I3XXU2_SULBS|nr:ATP-binding protein [Sulfurospirillum barnesii]AFL68766.1 hypothetical protein Sulba_1478 [Sulfurospirillum barnesii SES-3]